MIDTGQSINQQFPSASGSFTNFRQQLANAVSDIVPPDKTGALVLVAGAHGVRFGVASKIGDHWTVAGDFGSDLKGQHVTGQVLLGASW